MSLTSFLEQLNGSLNIVGLLLAIMGIILTYKSRKEKKPCYSTRSFNLVNSLIGNVESLKVLYSDKEIENVTISKVLFWNDGRETIDGSDITTVEPLFIVPKNNKQILDANIVYSKESANKFSLEKIEDNKGFQLKFDYVDKGEGIVIQIIHTGTSSKDLKINGKIKGSGTPKFINISRSPVKYPYLSFRQSQILIGTVTLFFPIVLGFLLINATFLPFLLKGMLGFLVVFSIFTTYIIFKFTVPKGFEAFYDDF